MAERRSMGEALQLTPKEHEFIRGQQEPGPGPTYADQDEAQVERASMQEAPATKRASRPPTKTRQRRVKPQDVVREEAVTEGRGHTAGLLVPVTTRLRPDTADALRRACLEQKLARKHPSTQQEIVEVAVRSWLTKNGHLAK